MKRHQIKSQMKARKHHKRQPNLLEVMRRSGEMPVGF